MARVEGATASAVLPPADRALEMLRQVFGYGEFRGQQATIIAT